MLRCTYKSTPFIPVLLNPSGTNLLGFLCSVLTKPNFSFRFPFLSILEITTANFLLALFSDLWHLE